MFGHFLYILMVYGSKYGFARTLGAILWMDKMFSRTGFSSPSDSSPRLPRLDPLG